MKRYLLSAILALTAAPALAADVGVSISVGQPGFYGRIDIGDAYPRPQLLYAQPVVVVREPGYAQQRPLYLRVPPGHAKHWRKHCREYNACGRQVYFVRDSWYNDVYAPRYREQHGDRGGYDRHDDRGSYGRDGGDRGGYDKHDKGRGHDQGDKGDRGRGNDKGHGNGHGNRDD
jgi:hypothetical protein